MANMNVVKRFGLNLLIVLDELGNTLILGSPDETISSRAAKAMLAGKQWGCILCKLLDLVQRDHCLQSLEQDHGTNALIPDGN
jgi:hypothetical protein